MDYDKVVVNTAWPYAYSVPHLGNMIGSLLSGDVFRRYYELIDGVDVIHVSGSDSHGTRIEYEAMKKGVPPEEIAYESHERIKECIKGFNILFDNYTITDTDNHKNFVKDFYLELEDEGYIFTKVEEHPYCENCELFLADKFITGECPYCGSFDTKGNQCDSCGKIYEAKMLKSPKCTICNKERIIMRETKHWYLDLEELEPEIREYVESHESDWDKRVKEYTNNFLKMGLKERPITRDIKWGIQAPFEGAGDKVFYVWVEAVLGYLSASRELLGEDYLNYWTGENLKHVYCMGKDNVPFHSIILPGLLIAHERDWHLPDLISSIEFLNFEGGKFSKTHNRGVWMDEALELLPAPYWRFYLLLNRPETHDYNFTWTGLEEAVNNILIGTIGNFFNRVLTFTKKYGVEECGFNEEDEEMLGLISETREAVGEAFEQGSLRTALQEIINLGRSSNKFFQEREPWKNEDDRSNTIRVCLELCKALCLLLYPFIPSVCEDLAEQLNMRISNFSQLDELFTSGHELGEPEIMVEKINSAEVKKKYEEIKKKE